MKNYNHQKNIEELEEKAMIYVGYDYTTNDPYKLAEAYFQFCQENLSEECGDYQIQPARFIYVKDPTVNAWATRRDGYYIIGVNMGTMTTLHQFFTERRDLFDLPEFKEYASIRGKLHEEIEIMMYNISIQFIFYHEQAHLIQYSPVGNTKSPADAEKIHEAYASDTGVKNPYNLEKHLKEFDADLNGAGYICLHLLDYWKRLDEADRTKENLELMLTLGASAVFTYFTFLLRNYPDMYYAASTHPHPLIRILYIVDMFIKTALANQQVGFTINPGVILNKTFKLTQAMFTHNNGEDWVKRFAEVFDKEKDKISAYVNEVLIPESRKRPNLVLERLAAKDNV